MYNQGLILILIIGIMIMQGDYTESESYAREYVATSLKLLVYGINNLRQCQILDEYRHLSYIDIFY